MLSHCVAAISRTAHAVWVETQLDTAQMWNLPRPWAFSQDPVGSRTAAMVRNRCRPSTSGAWEGHYTLDFIEENKSDVRPDTIHAETGEIPEADRAGS